MKKILSLFMAALFCLLSAASVFADGDAVTMTVDINPESGLVSLSGNIPAITKQETVSVVILNPGYTAADLSKVTDSMLMQITGSAPSADSTLPIVNHFAEVTTEADGSFAYSFLLCGNKGHYTVLFSYPKNAVPLQPQKDIFFVLKKDADDALALLNDTSKTAAEIQTILEENGEILGFDMEAYAQLEKAQKDCLTAAFMQARPYADSSAAKTGYAAALCFARLKTETNAEELTKLIAESNAQLGLDNESLYKTDFNGFTAAEKKAMCEGLLGFGGAQNLQDIKEQFLNRALCSSVQYAKSWTAIHALLLANAARITGFDAERYKALSSTTSVDKAIVGKSYQTPAALGEAINNAMKSGTSSGSSGSSGSGSSGGGSRVPGYTPGTTVKTDETKSLPFTDMNQTAWAKEAVQKLYQKNMVSGKSKTEFAPNELVTREEFAKLVVNVFGLSQSSAQCSFTDVDTSAWYAPYVAAAYENGMITGKDDGSFGVGETISRQDVCTIVHRAMLRLRGFNTAGTLTFADSGSIADYAKDAVAALCGAGIIHGMDDGRFAPQEGTTRAQAAVICAGLVG